MSFYVKGDYYRRVEELFSWSPALWWRVFVNKFVIPFFMIIHNWIFRVKGHQFNYFLCPSYFVIIPIPHSILFHLQFLVNNSQPTPNSVSIHPSIHPSWHIPSERNELWIFKEYIFQDLLYESVYVCVCVTWQPHLLPKWVVGSWWFLFVRFLLP